MWRTRVAVCQSSYASLQYFCDGHDDVALPWAASGRERCLWRRNTDEELSSWCVGPAWCHFHFLWWSEHPAEPPSRCRSRSKFTCRRWWNDDDVPLKCFVVSWNESVIMSLKWNNVTRKIVPISRFEQYLERSAKYENWLYLTELNLDGLVASDHCCCLVVVLLLTRWIHLGTIVVHWPLKWISLHLCTCWSYPAQWAAVRTQSGLIRIPPQGGVLSRAMKGIECGGFTSVPPIISEPRPAAENQQVKTKTKSFRKS